MRPRPRKPGQSVLLRLGETGRISKFNTGLHSLKFRLIAPPLIPSSGGDKIEFQHNQSEVFWPMNGRVINETRGSAVEWLWRLWKVLSNCPFWFNTSLSFPNLELESTTSWVIVVKERA